ncbi:MAG: DHH family phosphoesterase [Spirochaetaceae bacterium]|nr:DHH family phosphoesterase [Spirochaetaceae bacterium]
MPEKRFTDLLGVLEKNKPVVIQTHDYPDHDAIASGFSLMRLLEEQGFSCSLCYNKEIHDFSVASIIEDLGIPLKRVSSLRFGGEEQIILVDGIAGNRNVTILSEAPIVGIIDHHQPPPQIPECRFLDIRPGMGSCSTIIYQYYLENLAEIPRDVATALLAGLMMDTGQMTRGVGPVDLAAFSGLFFKGDWEEAAYVLRNSFSVQDIPSMRYAFDHYRRHGAVCFVEVPPVRPELLGLMCDYFLRMLEIHFVITFDVEDTECRLSLRSEDPRLPADQIVRRVVEDLGGGGGGHHHMSGGGFPAKHNPGGEELWKRFLTVIEEFYAAVPKP